MVQMHEDELNIENGRDKSKTQYVGVTKKQIKGGPQSLA